MTAPIEDYFATSNDAIVNHPRPQPEVNSYWGTTHKTHVRALERAKFHLEVIEEYEIENVGSTRILLASAWASLAAATRPAT